MLARDRLAGAVGHQLRILPLAGTHLVDRLSFKFDHRWRRERSARHSWLLLHGDELASLDATIDLVLDVLNTRLYDLRSTYATRLSAGGVADEWVTQLLRQGDAKVFKKYSQMKLQMKREALQKLNRAANEVEGGVAGRAG